MHFYEKMQRGFMAYAIPNGRYGNCGAYQGVTMVVIVFL